MHINKDMIEKISRSIRIYSELGKRAKEFEKDYIRINHDRLTVILSVVLALEILILFISDILLGVGKVVLAFIIVLVFLVPTFIVTNSKFDRFPLVIHKAMIIIEKY